MTKSSVDKKQVIYKVIYHFQGASADAGRIGLVIVVAGMAGSVVCGIVLDKFHKFK